MHKDITDIIINLKDNNESIILRKEEARDVEQLVQMLQNCLEYRISLKKHDVLTQEFNETKSLYEEVVNKQNPVPALCLSPPNQPNQSFLIENSIENEFEKCAVKSTKAKDDSSLKQSWAKKKVDLSDFYPNSASEKKTSPATIGAASEISRVALQMRENNERLDLIGMKTKDMANNSKSFFEQCRRLNEKN